MTINLLTESMLGHWRAPSGVWLCEFQFGSRLIYVEHRNGQSPDARLAAAQCLVDAAWDDLPQALMFAEKQCRAQMAELIRLYQAHITGESPLHVYSIHFELDNPYPNYAISKNPDFDWAQTLIFEDDLCQQRRICLESYEPDHDFFIYVRRVGFQEFELEN